MSIESSCNAIWAQDCSSRPLILCWCSSVPSLSPSSHPRSMAGLLTLGPRRTGRQVGTVSLSALSSHCCRFAVAQLRLPTSPPSLAAVPTPPSASCFEPSYLTRLPPLADPAPPGPEPPLCRDCQPFWSSSRLLAIWTFLRADSSRDCSTNRPLSSLQRRLQRQRRRQRCLAAETCSGCPGNKSWPQVNLARHGSAALPQMPARRPHWDGPFHAKTSGDENPRLVHCGRPTQELAGDQPKNW